MLSVPPAPTVAVAVAVLPTPTLPITTLGAIVYPEPTLDSSIDVTDGALWYHSRKVQPEWSMVYIQTVSIDNHIFYKDVD